MPTPSRVVTVPPERLDRWLAGFDDRHGGVTGIAATADGVEFTAGDGASAVVTAPFGTVPPDAADPRAALLATAGAPRTVGVLLVRLGGFAAGVFTGADLTVSKVGTRNVHGRNRKGGSSSGRFARRRVNQARELTDAAADLAVRLLLPRASTLDHLVTGGDRSAVTTVLDDPRLAPVRALVHDRFLTVPDPRHAVLLDTPALFRAVSILVTDPAAAS